MEEIIDISDHFDKNSNSNWSSGRGNSSSNFGSGIELLMNGKQNENKNKSADVGFDDISNLEHELNNLVDDTTTIKLNIEEDFDQSSHVRFNNTSLGESTSNIDTEAKTWDGYGKFNNIPVNPDVYIPNEPKMSKDEQMREKFRYLKKLEALERKGVQLSKKYDMESNFTEMKCEYDMLMEDKSREASIKLQANMLMTIIGGIEFLNEKFDPFDVDLNGWGDQVQENINDYDDVFGALHDKWKHKANVSPELQLLFQLGGSAVMVHMTNRMFKSAMPNMDDVLRQHPDLMRQFQAAAVSTMSNNSPGLSNYMSNMIPNNKNGPPPPPPMQTKAQSSNMRDQPMRSNKMRPDIEMARGVFADDGIDIRETNSSVPQYEQSSRRPEMKGPSDLSGILSGLKTKTINVNEPKQTQNTQQQRQSQPSTRQMDESVIELTSIDMNEGQDQYNHNDSSKISVDDIKSIEGGFNAPKRSKRRPKSDKQMIVLDF